ncbi:MAG: hypothetical protein QOF02_3731 [Blastocatellia bacterium]|jgi:predicted proteasome-type protease|nr:hypothetical protein [Blastocatellia bacterium]
MSEEEWQRKVDFILEHQARLTASQQKAEERFAQNEERIARLEDAQIQTQASLSALAESQARMSEAQARMLKAQEQMYEVVAVVSETHRHTEEKLEAFIGVLERFMSEGRNGKS